MTNRQTDWPTFWQHTLTEFWQQHAHEWVYQPKTDFNVHYALIERPEIKKRPKKLIILSSGRCETYLKNKELIYDLVQKGYSVLTVDHRGQGLSDRELSNHEKGHIEDFATYADDLNAIVQQTRVLANYSQCYILAHSMGATIALDWLYRYQPKIVATALSAPLLGINAGPLNHQLTEKLSQLFSLLCQHKTESPYFIGQTHYTSTPFNENELTHHEQRYHSSQAILARHDIRLGGVTVQWLNQTLKKITELNQQIKKLNSPVLLLQAEDETIVNNQGQLDWLNNAKQANKTVQLLSVANAKHEILQETDAVRDRALAAIFKFYEANHC